MKKKLDLNLFIMAVTTVATVVVTILDIIACINDFIPVLSGVIVFLTMVVSTISYCLVYKRDKNSIAIRYIIAFFFNLVALELTFLVGHDIFFAVSYVILAMFLVFLDVKLMLFIATCSVSMNIASTIRNILNGYMQNGDKIGMDEVVFFMVQNATMICYAGIMVSVSILINKMNAIKVSEIEEVSDNNAKLLDNTLIIARKVKMNATQSSRNMDVLNELSENSFRIFSEIADSNNANTARVEKQSVMSSHITELIENVVDDTKEAKKTTEISINNLGKGRSMIANLKNQSSEIINYNKEVLAALEDFTTSAKNVKNITAGIVEISEETNLLSLNASIESARAGEYGKGFAVVADEIRRLADQTGEFTKNIEKIVETLEGNAIGTTNIITKVINRIENENTIIDSTVEQFEAMEADMKKLESNMANIVDSTTEVVSYNKGIMKHVEELSSYTEELAAYTEDAMQLSKENVNQANNTKRMIDELEIVVDEFAQ